MDFDNLQRQYATLFIILILPRKNKFLQLSFCTLFLLYPSEHNVKMFWYPKIAEVISNEIVTDQCDVFIISEHTTYWKIWRSYLRFHRSIQREVKEGCNKPYRQNF